MNRHTRWFAVLVLALLAGDATAAVRRCVAEDGTLIYTDRACEHFDAREARTDSVPGSGLPATSAESGVDGSSAPLPLASYGPVAADCARTPEALLMSLRHLLDMRDVNGLSGLYHWPGTGKWSARAVMDRLEMIAAQSDGSAELVYPEAAFVVFDPEAYPGIPPEDPEAVRIGAFHESGLSEPSPPPLATLGVVRHAGCWWLRF
ncbi:MAG: hypothetical protein OZ919_05255 [Xanthomonadaceae bacterium]|nr:hypothetical protein [Xanthomonadaceae bacterium]